ncbi:MULTISPECIES: ribonuclease HII [Neobacillus]|uniref:Ribonuclease HII n=1 Tax=Neobacillus citreus TaxID=2833578 RepID=A0A942Y829_9BACI|nr:ribonuclease HII [Neobacillus citreus]MCH6267103.1 ribonuclease HII [Neobacillus citreus]
MKRLSIAEIEEQLNNVNADNDPFLISLEGDERKGVQTCLARWKKQRAQEKGLAEKFFEMTAFERKYRGQGFQYIAGVDEVGRGPLAGPVVSAAVILPTDFFLPGIDDSKKLSEKKRLEFDEIIRREALAFSVAMVHAPEIDEINIYQATKKAMKSAIADLGTNPDVVLIDAMKLDTPYLTESIIKGDAKSISIAAASIVAKTARDSLMKEISGQFPQYGFQENAGYGTKEHLLAIDKYGITPYHRKSFSPIKDTLTNQLTFSLGT